MGKIYIKEEFPCGYKAELLFEGFWLSGSLNHKENISYECPLHGKNCPPKKQE